MSASDSEDSEWHCCNFAIDTRPCAYWSLDGKKDNAEFLDGIEPRFFSDQVEWFQAQLERDGDRSRAAVAIRLLYGHALETFFSLLCASIQAPVCPIGWMLEYRSHELRSVVAKLLSGSLEYSRIPQPLSWETLSTHINRFAVEGPAQDSWIKSGFANSWGRFAYEFIGERFTDEHNSIKHGLRVRPGGFSLTIAAAGEEGSAPIIDSKSEFGTAYFARKVLTRHNITGVRSRRNWNPMGMAVGIELLSLSINNVLSHLKLQAGTSAETVQFLWPTGPDHAFEAPFEMSFTVGEMSGGAVLDVEDIYQRSAENILSTYDKRQT